MSQGVSPEFKPKYHKKKKKRKHVNTNSCNQSGINCQTHILPREDWLIQTIVHGQFSHQITGLQSACKLKKNGGSGINQQD
jgi:hypothetical protein